MKTWTLSEAKNKFSQVVEQALHEGPQEVSVATKEPVVIISRKDLEKLVPGGVKRFFETAPDLDDLADLVAQLKQQELALRHRLILVTGNIRHFQHFPIQIYNPF